MLNLPIKIKEKNILMCSIGGGFDIFGCLPILHSLEGYNITFSSFSLNKLSAPIYDYTGGDVGSFNYFPEKILMLSKDIPKINIIGKCGVVQLRSYYEKLIKENNIEHIITVDCGVDSLMAGDEEYKGTIAEEYVNFAALKGIRIPKTHICVGMGTEVEENISNEVVLGNIASLIKINGFIGSCSLVKTMECYKKYKSAYLKVNEVPTHRKSHIHPRIISSVEGNYGDEFIKGQTLMLSNNTPALINPLMSIFWVFDGDKIIHRLPILDKLITHTNFVQSVYEINQLPKIRKNTHYL